MQYYDSKSQLDGSEVDSQSAFEMHPWPSHYSSQASMASITPSYKSYLSTYTPSQASFFVLPVTAEAPNEMQRAQDNWGFAFCSLFCNPIFGIAALLLAEMSRDFFNKKNYLQASKYGSYAKGTALGGIIVTIVVLVLIIAQVAHYQLKFNY